MPDPSVPLMVCHRGANRLAPENTLAAAAAAFDLGAAYVELDVRTSLDGVLFVMHDRTVDRTTDGTGPIAAMTAAQIGRLDAGAWFGDDHVGEAVPTLHEMVDHARPRGGLYVEVKAADPAAVVAVIRDSAMLDACFFWSGDPAIRDHLHGLGVPMMIRHQDYADPAAAIERHRPAIMEFPGAHVPPAMFDHCRRHGVRVMAFCGGDDHEQFRQVVTNGVDLVNLDAPDTFAGVAAALSPAS